MTWEEKVEDFSNYLKFEKNSSENTIEAYLADINKLTDFAVEQLGDVQPDKISYEDLQEFLFQVSKEKYSERTQARWISSIKAFF